MRANHPARGLKATLIGLAVAATTVPLAITAAGAASPAPAPAAGPVHVFLVNTSLNPSSPNNVLVTGAFSDHGTGVKGTWHLTRGTIVFNGASINKIVNAPNFGTFIAASCSFYGVAKGTIPIVSGTGAYAGITGSLVVTLTEAAEGSLLANGKCNQANNAPTVAQDLIITGSGKVAF